MRKNKVINKNTTAINNYFERCEQAHVDMKKFLFYQLALFATSGDGTFGPELIQDTVLTYEILEELIDSIKPTK